MYIECYMHKNGIKMIAALPKLSYLIFHSFFFKNLNSKPAKKPITGSSIILNRYVSLEC